MKHWYMPLDVGRWFADQKISSLTSSQRGIYIDLRARMHDDDRCGLICKDTETMARLARCTVSELRDGLETLKSLFEVTERDGQLTVIDLEMRKEWKIRKNRELRNKRYRSKEGESPPTETPSETDKSPPSSNYRYDSDSSSSSEGKVTKGENSLSPLGRRIAGWFRRRETTKWDPKELKALKLVEAKGTPEEDIALLEQRYLSNAPFIRQDILTLLNHWNGEIDRAKKPQTNGNGHHQQPVLPGWKRLEAVDERLRNLSSQFSVEKDEGKRQSIREEISTLRAERKALGA